MSVLGSCAADDQTLDVFAAASLTDALTEIAIEFEHAGGPDVRLNFAGTSALREQLLDGAEADVFVAANHQIMDRLVAADAILGEPIVVAANRLVLAVPAGNPAAIETIEDLENPKHFVGLCAVGVPCGDLAAQVLTSAGVVAEPDTTEPDVRALFARLVEQELDVALVYASDVVASAGSTVEVRASGLGAGVSNQYPMATVAGGSGSAQDFVDFVAGARGTQILEQWGFSAP